MSSYLGFIAQLHPRRHFPPNGLEIPNHRLRLTPLGYDHQFLPSALEYSPLGFSDRDSHDHFGAPF
jgi:hypothetical protein